MSSTPASPPRRGLIWAARLVWLLFAALNFGLFIASLAQIAAISPFADCPTAESACQLNVITMADVEVARATGIPPAVITGFVLGASLFARLAIVGAGIIIFALRPNDWVAWLMSLVLLTVLVEGVSQLGALQWLADVSFGVGAVGWMPVPFIFPNGRVEPRWLKWPVVALTFGLGPLWTPATSAWLGGPAAVFVNLVSLLWVVLGLYALIYRYRKVSTPTERQQTKWVLVGLIATFATSLTYSSLQVLFPPWQPSPARLAALFVNGIFYVIGYGLLGLGLVFAMLRYRLWDIDVVIRRTLLYTALTASLALIYFGAVVVLQGLFSGLTGENNLAIIGSTLLIAALFQPLRRRLQVLIDRRFYRRKYDAAQALAGFAASARDDLELAGVTARLLAVVDDTMQPTASSVWLRPAGEAPPPAPR
ncbi:MAG: hypothetical protein IT317_00435 [Anaerolineales bacterium]|nr:hypothetical protein [Anaerolineales bacterium]